MEDTTITEWADFLRAVAALLWPILVFVILWIFRRQIRQAIPRIKKGKLLGQEFELDKALDNLDATAKSAAEETPDIEVPIDTGSATTGQLQEIQEPVQEVLREIPRSPRGALMILASELEREIRQFLASSGWISQIGTTNMYMALQQLEQKGIIRSNLAGSVRQFIDVRNRVVHGHGATEDDVIRAIDSGLTILKTVLSLPHEKNVVYRPSVEVYSDPQGKSRREDIHAVVLQTTSPGGASTRLRVFPTTRTHFEEGKRVAWEWNPKLIVNESWFRHPDTGQIEHGWNSSMEFIGRHLDKL
jgi:hypothetical protein